MQALEPPAELADDHELVVRFYRDILDIARRITVVAEQGRAAQFEALARESLEPGRSLRRQLSEHGCAILDRFGFFSDAQGC